MKKGFYLRIIPGLRIYIWLVVFFLILPSVSMGQANKKLLLTFRSKLTLQQTSAYGNTSLTVTSEGYAYLLPAANNTFSGSGSLTATMVFTYPQTGVVTISPLKGEGSFQVEGKIKGKNLLFWFKPGKIPCQGTISLNAPAPIGTTKESYVDSFDPAMLAPGGPGGWEIELKDRATKTVSYEKYAPISGQTTFTLDNAEVWRISVEGVETDDMKPPIQNQRFKNEKKELPISVTFKWSLAGEFVILGKGQAREYYDGNVMFATLTPTLNFEGGGLYICDNFSCKEDRDINEIVGATVDGKVSSGKIKLTWPEFHSVACILCKPTKSYLGKVPYREKFGTLEFISRISSEKIPLTDGGTINGSVHDWMKYRITLHKTK